MDEWHRERSLNVFGRTCVDVQDGLSGNPGGSPQPRNVHHHQSTASVPHPMHLPHTNGPRISPHHQAIVEAEAECNSQTIPSLGVSRLTMSVPVRDRGIAKFSPPSSGEFNARPPAPMEGLGILLNSKERFSPLVQQDVEYQAAAQAIDHRDSLSPSQCDGVLGPQRAQSTRSPRSQARLLPPGDAPPINGGLIRRQPLKLRKTCDACGKHKKACDGKRPCYRCMRRKTECVFGVRKRTGPKRLKDDKGTPEATDTKTKAMRSESRVAAPSMSAQMSPGASDSVVERRGGTFITSSADRLVGASLGVGNDSLSCADDLSLTDSCSRIDNRMTWLPATTFPRLSPGDRPDADMLGLVDPGSNSQGDFTPRTNTSDVRPTYSRGANGPRIFDGDSLPRVLDGGAWPIPAYPTKPLSRPAPPSSEVSPPLQWPYSGTPTPSRHSWHSNGPSSEMLPSTLLLSEGRASAQDTTAWHQASRIPSRIPADMEGPRARGQARGGVRHSLEASHVATVEDQIACEQQQRWFPTRQISEDAQTRGDIGDSERGYGEIRFSP